MAIPLPRRALCLLGVFAFLLSFLPSASAECSDSRVKRLSRQGKTVASIASTCEMSKKDVQAILEEDEETGGKSSDDRGGQSGLPSGTPVGQCGCWGPVNPGHRETVRECRSGYARPRMCNSMCMGGGYAWRGVCT